MPAEYFEEINSSIGLVELLAFCSFGIPRNFLNLARDIYDSRRSKTSWSNAVFDAISKSCRRSDELFLSLKVKLARYSNYVETGEKVFRKSISEIKKYNKNKDIRRQSVALALKSPVDENMSRVIGFLEYSGLIFPTNRKISRGVKGSFQIYYLSLSHLVDNNAIVGSKQKRVSDFIEALEHRHPHEFTRVSVDTLLTEVVDKTRAFQLALSPCSSCSTPRLNESAKFCHICGAPLKEASVFYELIEKDISVLPLTKHRINRIKQNSDIRVVGDILNDIDHRKLQSVPNVGVFWAKRINEYAEEYIS